MARCRAVRAVALAVGALGGQLSLQLGDTHVEQTEECSIVNGPDGMNRGPTAASSASAGNNTHSEEGDHDRHADPERQAATGTTVAKEPGPRPKTVKQLPRPRCPL